MPFGSLSPEAALDYAAEDADITLRLYKLLKPKLAFEKMVSVYETLERPLIGVLAEMERTGIQVDAAVLKNLSNEFSKRLSQLEVEIFELVGHDFNINSPKQLGEILFEEMGISETTFQGHNNLKTDSLVIGILFISI